MGRSSSSPPLESRRSPHAAGPTCRSRGRRAELRRHATRHRQSARERRRSRRASAASEGSGAGTALLLERGCSGPCRKGDLVDASPAKMRIHPSQDHRGAVLGLECESAFDPEDEKSRRRPARRDRVWRPGGGRCSSIWPGTTRTRVCSPRTGWPIGDQARLAQAKRAASASAINHGARNSASGLAAAPALHHRFGTESEERGA